MLRISDGSVDRAGDSWRWMDGGLRGLFDKLSQEIEAITGRPPVGDKTPGIVPGRA